MIIGGDHSTEKVVINHGGPYPFGPFDFSRGRLPYVNSYLEYGEE